MGQPRALRPVPGLPGIVLAALLALTQLWGVAASRQLSDLPADGAHRKRQPGHGLPDSVLAVVGPHRRVTAGDLAGAMSPASANSLTPQAIRRFLDLLIDREALAERAGAESWAWTLAESAGYRALRDRLSIAAMLDSILESGRRRLAAVGKPPDDQTLGIAIRDSLVAGMNVVFDDALVERLARAWAALPRPRSDSSAAAQVRMLAANPRINASDSGAVLARSRAGDYRVSELLDSWRRLSAAYRPHIETGDHIRDLARNGLFERALREEARRAGLDRRPDIAAIMARARDEIATAHLIEREVVAVVRVEEKDLERHYRERKAEWRVPGRIRLLRLAGATRTEAEREALKLRDPAEAARLTELAARQGLDFVTEITAESDPALFAEAAKAGAGAVLGPTSQDGSWWVTRVEAILPARERPLSEVRVEVERDARAADAARHLAELCRRARRGVRIEVNEAALESLAKAPSPSASQH